MSGLKRRGFLQLAAVASGGLALGVGLGGCQSEPRPWPNARSGVFQPNAFLQLDPDGTLTLSIHRAEMGQGVMTGLATLVCEELAVDPARLRCEFAGPHKDYLCGGEDMMITGGSASIATSFEDLRRAGATMREMLREAAAANWGVALADCVASNGVVALRDGSQQASYGDLALAAARLPLPQTVALKPADEWQLIGKYDRRVDAAAKVDGSAVFAGDVLLPGMLTGVMLRCPHFGGALRGFDASRALAAPGVRHVLEINGAVAVLADGYWQARSAAALIEVQWDKGVNANLDSAAILAEQSRLLREEEGRTVRETGTLEGLGSARVIEAEYRVPYLAHATMEPMSAVATVTASGAEVWAGNQAPDLFRDLVARALEIPADSVTIHSTFLGGGFGRRVWPDFAIEAALAARAAGVPVKLLWSREDDMRHDYYRPSSLTRMQASVDAAGKLVAWDQRIVTSSIMAEAVPVMGAAMLPQWLPAGVLRPMVALVAGRDDSSFEGAADLPYAIPNVRVQYVHYDPGVPVGFWRSVGHSQNAFFTEGFSDELAQELGEDPLRFRLERLPAGSRETAVLQRLAIEANWGKAPTGVFQGLAVHRSFGTVVGEVVELTMDGNKPVIRRVVCVVDCGVVINPDVVRTQVQSAVVYGLTAALHGEISIREGAVEQGNFDDYPALRMNECPSIEVHMLDNDRAPSGIGEPGLPPLAPALANAIFAATGQRLRSLPLRIA